MYKKPFNFFTIRYFGTTNPLNILTMPVSLTNVETVVPTEAEVLLTVVSCYPIAKPFAAKNSYCNMTEQRHTFRETFTTVDILLILLTFFNITNKCVIYSYFLWITQEFWYIIDLQI